MKRKGISLIVLIITIVVIIILATTIIVNIANTNLIKNANMAVSSSDISTMKDELAMYISDKYAEKLGDYESEKLQATEEGIWYGSAQLEGTITDILTSMSEKYVGKLFIQDGKLVANKMKITVEEEKWLDDLGIESAYQIEIGKINIEPSTQDWTNENIDIQISYSKEILEGYVLEYRLTKIENDKTVIVKDWTTYENIITVEENNTKITARLYNKDTDNEAVINSYEVSNIDKESPTVPTSIEIKTGTNSITAVASGSTDDLSGISKYQYSLDGNTWQDSGIFSGLDDGTQYKVYARAVDKAENISEVQSNMGTTIELYDAKEIANNASTLYGSTVNYATGNTLIDNSTEWQIFHSDGENIYLISKEYMKNTLLPTGFEASSDSDTSINYPTNLSKTYENTWWNENKSEHPGSKWVLTLGRTYTGVECCLLDTKLWEIYKDLNGKASYVIGAPTPKLFAESYNSIYADNPIYYYCQGGDYEFAWNQIDENDMILSAGSGPYVSGLENGPENLYVKSSGNYLLIAQNNDYWDDGVEQGMLAVSSDNNICGFIFEGYDIAPSIRPVVCLNSDVMLLENSDGTYNMN